VPAMAKTQKAARITRPATGLAARRRTGCGGLAGGAGVEGHGIGSGVAIGRWRRCWASPAGEQAKRGRAEGHPSSNLGRPPMGMRIFLSGGLSHVVK
jgi:hypothetical protein